MNRAKILILFCVFFALVCAHKIHVQNGKENEVIGARAVVLQSGLNTLAHDLIKLIVSVITSVEVPDFTTVQRIPLFGDVEIKITALKFNTVKIGHITLQTIPTKQVKVSCDGIEFGISLSWSTYQKQWPHAKAHGGATIRTANALAFGIVETSLQNLKPAFKSVQISVNMGDFHIKITGGVIPGILDALEGMFHGIIKSYIQTTLQQQIAISINDRLNPLIQAASFLVDLPGINMGLDLSMPQPFGLAPEFVSGSFIGEFVPLPSKEHAPFTPVALPSSPIDTQGFQVHLSEYTMNTLGFSLAKIGYLSATILPSQVPPSSPIQLNTTSLKYMLPELFNKYPNRGIKLEIAPVNSPNFRVTSQDGLILSYSTTMFFYVLDPVDNSSIPAFILKGDIAAQLSQLGIAPVSVASFNVTGFIKDVNISLELQESFIGNMSVTNLNNMIRVLVKSGVVLYYNKLLKEGITINLPPESGLVVSNPSIRFQDGYVSLLTNVEYKNQQAIEKPDDPLQRILSRVQQLSDQLDVLKQEVMELF